MYKNYIIGVFLSFLFLISQNTYSQVEPCKTNTVHQEMLAADPNYKATFEKMQADLQRHIAEKMANSATNRTEATVYTVPVVVHVIHTGGAVNTAYNPSDANINAMLNKINTDFRNTTFGADAEINFVLAQRDPNCNATTGINRVNGSGLANYVAGGVGTGGAADADVKALSRWPNTDYYNIWVVNKIDGNDGTSGSFTAGYAYFPGASAAVDGTVILASQTNGTSETMTHELGHAFALQHTFHKAETGDDSANGTDCPLNTDCTTQGDLICDTDPHAYMLGAACNTGNCSGVSAATLANYMSYCNGTDRFTPNQVTRMRTALETQRGGLITSLGGTAPVTAPTTACTPTNTGSFSAAGITRFVLNNLNVSSQSSQFEGTNYVNRVCGQGTTLNAGSSHSITIETSINVHNVKVYVDYNNDGDFIDTGEEIASGITPNTVGTKSFTATYNVPNSGVLFNQPLRLRAVASLIGDGVATSCEVFRGQAEDYALTIQSVATPTVSLSVSTNAGSETATTAVTVTATSSSAVSGAQTVDLAVTGTNITAGDYTLSSGTITIANGATTGTATFTVVDDALVEGTETAILTISNPSAGMTLGTPVTQNVVITDNDALPTVSLSVSTNAGTEAATTAVTVTATSSSAVSGAQTVDLAVTGTNITAGDYTLSSGTITIANGATTGTATFTVVDDALVEGTETATLTISNPSAGMTLGTPVTQNVVITDNDSATGNITNVNQTTFYSTIQAAVDAANDGETLKILVNNTYAENVTITNKSLTFTSDATDYTQITVKQIIFNGTGKTLTISTHMGISEILNMQEGNVVVTGGNDFALRSTSTGTALIINDDANTVVGNVIMERFIPASSTIPGFGGTGQDGLGYRLFSSPFSDATISQFGDDMAAGLVLNTAYNTAPEPAFVRPFPTFFQYEETNNGATTSAYYNPFISNYKVPTTPNLTVARGYQANIATGVTVDLNGTLNNGNQSIAVTNSGGAGYNLIGNPYPSPISWTALHGFGTNNTFLNSEVQFDIPIGQYEGSFASYTAAGVSNNGGKDSIACMQGFFVRTAVGGTVTMNNTVRWDTDTRFFKTQATKGAKDGLVRVALRKDGIMDETTIYFQEGATPAYDASFDAGKLHKINSKYSTLYSYNENVEAGKEEYFSINGLGSFDTEQKLPLAMNIVTDGEYEITLRDMKYFHSKHEIYLYDSLTDSLHNLRAEGDYKFVSTKGTEIKRFVLLFKTDANADFFENERVMVYPNPTPNEFSYSLKTAREGNYTIRLFDATGRIILEENKIKEGAFLEGTINLEKHASGLYLLQVSDAEKTTTVRVVKE